MIAGSISVLYVDDDPNMTDLAESMLGREDDIEVVTTTDPTSVSDRISDGDYDCIVSDYEMPGLDGLELYARVRPAFDHPEFPYILFTGRGSESVAADALNAGVTGYLQKGGLEQYKLLANRIRNATEKYRARIVADRYQTVIDALDYPIYVVDADGRFRFVNEPFAELTGYDREELRGRETKFVKPPETVERAETELGQLLSDDGPDVARFRAVVETADGDRVPCRDHMGVLPYEGDEFRGSVGILRVLTAVDTAAEADRTSRLSELQETARTLIAAGSETAIFDIGIEAVRDILGYELAAHYQYDTDTDTFNVVTDAGLEAAESDDAMALSRRALDAGDPVVSEDPAIPDRDPAVEIAIPVGDTGVLVAATTDPTATPEADREFGRVLASHLHAALHRVDRERALARRNDRLDDFASVVSHELRNPLDFAVAHRELAAEKYGEDEHFEHIETAHSRMTSLIEDVLLWAREGIDVTVAESVSIDSVAAESWEAIQGDPATLSIETDRTVSADRGRLKQLFDNLFENAVDHAGESATIRVGDLDGDGIFVADDGPGIPKGEWDSVFDSGYTLSTHGTGIGLALVEQIADAHGWEIEIAESDDGGARFELRFDPYGT